MKISPSAPVATPAKYYPNSEICKVKILSDNQNKSGVYMWENLTNGKCYIGSAVDLYFRLSFYFSISAMQNSLIKSKSYIYNAILKHGHSNFSLTILEYCSPEKCIEREDFYLSSLQHKYNILEKAGSLLGFKHSQESKTIMSDNNKGENNHMFGKNHSDNTRKKISEANKGKTRAVGAGSPSQAIEVFDKNTNETITYESISAAARALNINQARIVMYFSRNQQKPYKGRYIFKKL